VRQRPSLSYAVAGASLQAVRALKTILDRGYLGKPVLATIEMRAVPHWQAWLRDYKRLTLLNMSVHHIDAFRYLFGEPEAIFVSARKDPRTRFAHEDGICLYIMEYEDGFRATAWDDIWTGPRTPHDDLNPFIRWRVEGTEGIAGGTIGWPTYPNHTPSTMTFTCTREPNVWVTPRWSEVWFPDAFQGPMTEVMTAICTGIEPPTNGVDNLKTMAIVEAGYRSIKERRSVPIAEIDAEAFKG
jgi:predicted dehydrogenase